ALAGFEILRAHDEVELPEEAEPALELAQGDDGGRVLRQELAQVGPEVHVEEDAERRDEEGEEEPDLENPAVPADYPLGIAGPERARRLPHGGLPVARPGWRAPENRRSG